ncbi:hypothetical protein RND71_038860 [Anisodus tanguticus]|uniref:F-box associated beta-propeller type 1 domain-containing protein n=1 Tax=Anisodus tanguticus TaxID=243964 RepID=A0AAE1UZJ2_9SOLA|nr:hypothetical protein RND71_038860 [Anisodus tanguticus]
MDCVWGLGYDATSDDYKILALDLNASAYAQPNVSVEILSLKSGSWRRIGNYPTDVCRLYGFRDSGVDYLPFVHGAFHWLGGVSQYYTIISFNISNEVYGEIPLLERMCNISHSRIIDHGVSVLGGMLCFYSTYDDCWQRTFKLWVMKDYGIKESWTKLITIRDANLFHSARPKHMFADGEVLLRCKHMGCFGTVTSTLCNLLNLRFLWLIVCLQSGKMSLYTEAEGSGICNCQLYWSPQQHEGGNAI